MSYTKEDLLLKLDELKQQLGRFPTRRELRSLGKITDDPYYRIFGSLLLAQQEYEMWQRREGKSSDPASTAQQIIEDALRNGANDEELKLIIRSLDSTVPKRGHIPVNTKETNHFKCIATGDSHIGHKEFREDWWDSMIERGIKEDVDFMYHTGDILEGMSGRPGHIYELSEIGFEAQFSKARSKMNDIPFPVRAITGNHDLWYAGKADQGVCIGSRLADACPNFTYLGAEEYDDEVAGIIVKLWHGRDGSQYAYSYRTQKFIESIYGGTKPNILLAGHAHKSVFYESRNIHVFETGTTCSQTGFMRHKKMAAHTGYWIIECWTNDDGVVRLRPEWNPFY